MVISNRLWSLRHGRHGSPRAAAAGKSSGGSHSCCRSLAYLLLNLLAREPSGAEHSAVPWHRQVSSLKARQGPSRAHSLPHQFYIYMHLSHLHFVQILEGFIERMGYGCVTLTGASEQFQTKCPSTSQLKQVILFLPFSLDHGWINLSDSYCQHSPLYIQGANICKHLNHLRQKSLLFMSLWNLFKTFTCILKDWLLNN